MAPTATPLEVTPEKNGESYGGRTRTTPLEPTGILDQYEHFDLTPVIGREFPTANVVEWLQSPNADELLTELAYIISSRGVVFFRKQDNLTNDLQKHLIQRIGELSGKPRASTLHIHPVLNTPGSIDSTRDPDPNISTISTTLFKKVYALSTPTPLSPKKQSSDQWHSDIPFEPVPADYSSLRLTTLPTLGGDTLWASGYELYDRLSPPIQTFLESLTCTFSRPDFLAAASRASVPLYTAPRGHPLNVGEALTATHPLIRTNPITGWKSLYPVGQGASHIPALTAEESHMLLTWFNTLLKENHDLQCRFRWEGRNDFAVWDNRCTFHCATFDFEGLGERAGMRVVGIGEVPYLDRGSCGRREGVGRRGEVVGGWFSV